MFSQQIARLFSQYTHQDSNLEPSVPKTDALSNCAMGAIEMTLYGFRGSEQYMSKVTCADLGLLRSRMVETL